jgi:hypothetical protein
VSRFRPFKRDVFANRDDDRPASILRDPKISSIEKTPLKGVLRSGRRRDLIKLILQVSKG